MRNIQTVDDLDTALASERALIYKHSSRCELSASAKREVAAFAENFPDAAVYVIDVIADRPLSDALESRLELRHESPQAILIEGGHLASHASHRAVRETTLAGWWQDSQPDDRQRTEG